MKTISRQIKGYTFVFFSFISIFGLAQERIPVILDADTANEVDDIYALSRALIEPSWDILALNAVQWQASHWTEPRSMENSHRLNQVLLAEMGLDIKTRRGGVARMYDWGDMAQHSAAAYEIIQQAKALPEEQKLTVIALGALTNIASAIYIDPSITSRISLYWIGSTYDFEEGVMKKQDFNAIMDVQALEIILMSEVELYVLPINIAAKMQFDYEDTKSKLLPDHSLTRLLLDRWYEHLDGGRKSRVIWDLALIQALIHPELTKTMTLKTSKENGSRTINYISDIDAERMKTEFFEQINAFMAQLPKR